MCFVLPISAYLNDMMRGENEKKGMLNHFKIVGNKSTIWSKRFLYNTFNSVAKGFVLV